MSGFSLKMHAVRGILTDIIRECSDKALKVKAVSFDGQFLKFAQRAIVEIPLQCVQYKKIFGRMHAKRVGRNF